MVVAEINIDARGRLPHSVLKGSGLLREKIWLEGLSMFISLEEE